MNNTHAHQKLVDDILFAVGTEFRDSVRLFPRRVGLAVPIGSNRPVYFGLKGETDLAGFIGPRGRILCIEVKTGQGRLTKEQRLYRDMVLRFGGVYIEARSLEQVLREVRSVVELEKAGGIGLQAETGVMSCQPPVNETSS